MHFDISPSKNLSALLGKNCRIRVDAKSKTDGLFSRFASIFPASDFASRLAVKAIAIELLSIFIEKSQSAPHAEAAGISPSLSSVFSYIESNIPGVIKNGDLAEILHMHPTHFIRFFKRETGKTPKEYITCRKMEIAKAMLANPDMEINEISDRLGFFDSMHFSRVFKKIYSVSPTAYRKILLKS
jgi:AraC-like DNA-binding protein